MQEKVEFLFYQIYYLLDECFLRRCRKKPVRIDVYLDDYPEEYLRACQTGNKNRVEKFLDRYHDIDINASLRVAVEYKQVELSKFFVEKGATNLDECLKIACDNNNYSIVELLLKAGADTRVAIRYTKSSNILRMVYRFEQNTSNIN